MLREKKNFTIIELLVVIAIIAILVSILLPALKSARSKGMEADCLSRKKQLGLILSAYSSDFDDYLQGARGDWYPDNSDCFWESWYYYAYLPAGTINRLAACSARDFHHKIDVFQFRKLADRAIAEIRARGRRPILAGGTGMYLRALLYGIDDLPADPELRKRLDAEFDHDAGEPALLEKMAKLDPAAFDRWHACRRRLIRALEVRLLTGKSILELQQNPMDRLRYPVIAWKLETPTEILRKRISDRGLELVITDQAKDLIIRRGYDPLYGARPLRRYLQSSVETLIARRILSGDLSAGSTLTVDVQDGELVCR